MSLERLFGGVVRVDSDRHLAALVDRRPGIKLYKINVKLSKSGRLERLKDGRKIGKDIKAVVPSRSAGVVWNWLVVSTFCGTAALTLTHTHIHWMKRSFNWRVILQPRAAFGRMFLEQCRGVCEKVETRAMNIFSTKRPFSVDATAARRSTSSLAGLGQIASNYKTTNVTNSVNRPGCKLHCCRC